MQRPETCSVDACKRPYRAKGYCRVHYKKWRRGEMQKKGRYTSCGKEGCHKPMFRFGVCEAHYRQATSKGTAPAVASAAPAPEAAAESTS